MPATYKLIASNTLSSSAASVTFSSIPATYTDLVLRFTVRTDRTSTADTVSMEYNADSATNYSLTRIVGTSAAASSTRFTSQASLNAGVVVAASATSNTFSSNEIYFPSYLVSQNKPISALGVAKDNNTTASMHIIAALWSNTAALSSMVLTSGTASNFVSGSSFFLYGIKNS